MGGLSPEAAQLLQGLRDLQNKQRRSQSAETPGGTLSGNDLDERIRARHPELTPEELKEIARAS